MSIDKEKKKILELLENDKESFFETSMSIWKNPELALQEYFAQEQLVKILEDNGFKVEKGLGDMPTSFVAECGSGKPVIGFSSEFDCLPGLSQNNTSTFKDPIVEGGPGHGCGHNLIAVGGIQAAVSLKKIMEETGMKGTLKVFGTPAEEICIGKPFMARAGCFEGLDAVLDWHPSELNLPGYRSCPAYFNVKYHFKGKSAHGNAPWRGVSALDSAMLMGHAIELLREHVDPGPENGHSTINYAFPDCNNAYPVVVPDKSIIWIVGRIFDSNLMQDVLRRIRDAAEGCAKATGTEVTEEFITATHNMIPNKVISEVMYDNFLAVGPPDYSEEDQNDAKEIQKSMGCNVTGYDGVIEPCSPGSLPVTDSSEYSWFAPLGILSVALSPSVECASHNWAVCYSAGSPVGMKTVLTASKVLALTAYDLLNNPELLAKAQDEFNERTGGVGYTTLLPEGCIPDITTNRDIMEKLKK